MLSLFRINDIPRILLLGVILLLIRLPFYIKGIPVLETEFEFRLLSEALAEGRLIYRDVWHYVSPLSAFIFQIVGEAFGRDFIAFQAIGYMLLFIQALYFNSILNDLDALADRTLIPVLLYVFFGSILIEQFGISQELLGMFPFLLFLKLTMSKLRYGAQDEGFFTVGLILSVAALFNGVFIWLLPFVLFYFPFVFVMNPKRFSLLISGFMFPMLCTLFYFALREGMSGLLEFYFFELVKPFYLNHLSITQYIVLGGIPIALLLLGAFQSIFSLRLLNYQSSFNNLLLLMIIFSIPLVVFAKELSFKTFYPFIPLVTFFTSQLYINLRRRGINELIFSGLLILLVLINFGFTYKVFFNPEAINLDRMTLNSKSKLQNKKLCYLGEGYGTWYENQYSGPFLFHPFTEDYFNSEPDLDQIGKLHDYFDQEIPESVIDPANYFEDFRERNLLLKRRYKKVSPSLFIKVD